MRFFDWLFGHKHADRAGDDKEISDPEAAAARPMAGVGAEVAGEDKDTESKKALDDAVLRDQARW